MSEPTKNADREIEIRVFGVKQKFLFSGTEAQFQKLKARREKYDPTADREHSLNTRYPSKSSLIVNPTARQQTPATLKSP